MIDGTISWTPVLTCVMIIIVVAESEWSKRLDIAGDKYVDGHDVGQEELVGDIVLHLACKIHHFQFHFLVIII